MIRQNIITSRYRQKQKLNRSLADRLVCFGQITEMGLFEAPLQGNVGMVEICATKGKKERETAEITWELLNRIGKRL
jgi:hypothetical protein